MSFKDYKKNRVSNFDALKDQLANINKPFDNAFEDDPDDWYPGVDKTGNGLAIVRFLPGVEAEKGVDVVTWFEHRFKCGDKWYIENSLTSKGNKVLDPCGVFNKKLWNSVTNDADPKNESPARKQAKDQKRKNVYRVNLLVLSDSSNPENNGKIKKWRFGKSIYNFIDFALYPPVIEGLEEQTASINPFDLIEGANFRISIFTKKDGGNSFRDYSRSKFDNVAPVFKKEEDIEKLYNTYNAEPDRWSLSKYVSEDKFKSYEDLKARLDLVVGFDTSLWTPRGVRKAVEEDDVQIEVQPRRAPGKSSPTTPATKPKTKEPVDEDETNDASFFESLVDDDVPF